MNILFSERNGYIGRLIYNELIKQTNIKIYDTVESSVNQNIDCIFLSFGCSNNNLEQSSIDVEKSKFVKRASKYMDVQSKTLFHLSSYALSNNDCKSSYIELKNFEEYYLLTHSNVEQIVSLRLTSVLGEYQKNMLLWDSFNKFSEGRVSFSCSKSNYRNYIYITDVVKVACNLINSDYIEKSECSKHKVINIGSPFSYNIREVIRYAHKTFTKIKSIKLKEPFFSNPSSELVFQYKDIYIDNSINYHKLEKVLHSIFLSYDDILKNQNSDKN